MGILINEGSCLNKNLNTCFVFLIKLNLIEYYSNSYWVLLNSQNVVFKYLSKIIKMTIMSLVNFKQDEITIRYKRR